MSNLNPFVNTDQVNAVIKVRRGLEADRTVIVPDVGELIYSTNKNRLFVGDNVTYGGINVGNKTWETDNFQKLNSVEVGDLVYRTDTNSFYLLTASNYNLISNYLLVGGKQLVADNTSEFSLTPATPIKLGGVKPLNGLTVSDDGTLSIDHDETLQLINNKLSIVPVLGDATVIYASYDQFGITKITRDNGLKITDGNLSVSLDNTTIKLSTIDGIGKLYVDPEYIHITKDIASITTLGNIKIGDGLSAGDDGITNLKIAKMNQLGGIKIGNGLSGSDDGTLSLDGDNFETSLSSNGYQILPSGLIMQWGSAGGASSNPSLVKFPINFPNSCFSVVITNNVGPSNVTPTQDAIATFNVTFSGFSFRTNAGNTGGYNGSAGGPTWQAIGY